MAGADHFRLFEFRRIVLIVLFDILVGDVDMEIAFQNVFGGGGVGPFFEQLLAGEGHGFDLAVKGFLGAEFGFGVLHSLFGRFFGGGLVVVSGPGAEELDADEVFEEALLVEGQLVGVDLLALGRKAGFEVHEFVLELGCV